MNTSRSRPLTTLSVAGPFSMGYVDFYTDTSAGITFALIRVRRVNSLDRGKA